MKQLVRLLRVFTLVVSCAILLIAPQKAYAANFNGLTFNTMPVLAASAPAKLRNRADDLLDEVYGEKIDLNNTNIRSFQKFPGLYPTLASKIVQNAPFDKVEDVLQIKGLSDRQKQILQSNLDNFVVNPRETVFTEGDDRYNNGIYR